MRWSYCNPVLLRSSCKAAVGAQSHDLLNIVPRARWRALAYELQAPEPLTHIGADTEKQGCIFFAKPLQHLERRARVGPWLGVAY